MAFTNHYKPFLKFSYKAFVIKPFQILFPVLIGNTIETLTSKKCCVAKFCKVVWCKAFFFTGETSFSSQFFFNIPEISAKIQKPAKY